MKTHTLNISTISVLCVLCAGLTTNAMAAGSVRALGGAGTYNGTAAASSSTRTAPARAGSLRVSPSTARLRPSATTSTGNTSESGTVTAGTGQRLSIGKYLGTTATTPVSVSTTAKATAAGVEDLEGRVGELENTVGSDSETGSILGRVTQLENRHITSSDSIVVIDGDDVSIDVDNLVEEMVAQDLMPRESKIKFENNKLQWQYANEGDTWHELLDIVELTGDYVSTQDLSDAISGLASTYATKTALSEGLATKANVSDVYTKDQVYTKGEVDTAIAAGVDGVDLSGYATTTALNQGLAGKANADDVYTKNQVDSALSAKANAADVTSALATKANADDVTSALDNLSETVAGITGEGGTLSDYAKIADVNTALATKADADDVADLAIIVNDKANQSDLETLQNTVDTKASQADLDTLSETVAGITGEGGTLSDYAKIADVDTALATKADASDVYTKDDVDTKFAGTATKVSVQAVASDVADLTTVVAGKANSADLAAVATSGSYNDLLNTPTIPNIPAYTGSDYEVVWGYVDGVGQYIKVVDASGN